MPEWDRPTIQALQDAGLLLVEDGNHGEYRPRRDEFTVDGVAFVRAADMDSGRVNFSSVSHINAAAFQRIRKGIGRPLDVLLSHKGTVGKVAWVGKSPPPFVCSPQTTFYRSLDLDSLDPRFIYFYLQSPEFVSQLGSRKGETDMADYVSLTEQRRLHIPLPPLPEQRAIANILGALDDKIEANRRLVQLLLSHIAETWRLHFESNRAEWPERPIGEVVRVVGGSTPRTTVEAFWDGDIAWAAPRDLSRLPSAPLLATERRITKLGLRQISSGLLPRGTVLLSSRAPIGYLAIAEIPLAVNQGFIGLVPGERLPGLYLWQWLSHHVDEILSRANGTTFLEVSKANFRPMPISLPPAKLVEMWLEPAESMYAAIVGREVESNALGQLRDVLLPKLLSGELRVREAESLVGEAV